MFRFVKKLPTLFQSGCTILDSHPQSMWVPVAPHIHHIWPVSVLECDPSDRRVVVFHCCFNLHLPDDVWCGMSFRMLTCHLYIFFSEVSVKFYGPFLSQFVLSLLSLTSVLSILGESFIRCILCKHFLPACVACLLNSLDIVFTEQKYLILMKCSLSIIYFMNHVFGVVSKKYHLGHQSHLVFLLCYILEVL